MKKILLIAGFALMLMNSYAQNKKVAVVTFYIDKHIDVLEFSGAAQAAMLKLCDDPNFNLTPILNEFHNQFFNSYVKDFPFQLLPESEVTGNEAYKNYKSVTTPETGVFAADKYVTTIDGYHAYPVVVGHPDEKNMLPLFPQVDGVMHVSIKFRLVKIGLGNMGVTKMKAIARIILFNKKGDQVFNIEEDANSKGIVPLVAGVPVMSYEKIMPMCESSLNELMLDLQKRMPKLVKKADAKL